jgi:hypothetical protein
MPPRLRLFFSLLTGSLLLIPALGLLRELSKPSDIWWTPKAMALSLAQSRDRVEIYARGKSLGALLSARQLAITDAAGSSALGADEIGLRFNNWDRVRAARIPLLMAYAAAIGAGAVLFLVVASGRLAYKAEEKPVASTW